jgi:hypothetical protein
MEGVVRPPRGASIGEEYRDGYCAVCPLAVRSGRVMHLVPRQSAPDWIKKSPPADPDTLRERTDMGYPKRYRPPLPYWNLMLKGRAWRASGLTTPSRCW